jgi:hypothetical protein
MKTAPATLAVLVLLVAAAAPAAPRPAEGTPPGRRMAAVPFTRVTVDDSFWAPRRRTN